jgi:hypothetical protein
MKKLLSALFVLALCSSVAFATVPDPSKCTVVPADNLVGVVTCPDSPGPITATVYTVTVKNSAGNPINNASVAFEFPVPTNIKNCTTANNTGTTNTSGIAVITLRGGGCQVTSGSVYACLVKANGVVIRSYYNAKSPDYDGAGPNGTVNLQDLLAFRNPVVGCHDYDNNSSMNLSDTLIFAPAYSPQHTCTLAP